MQCRPTVAIDPDGRAINLLAAAIGAGVGAIVGGGIEAGRQLWADGRVSNWASVGASAAGGAVSGGLAGLTMGGSLVVQAGVAGATSVAGGATTRALTGQEQSVTASAQDFAVGVVTFGLVKGGSATVQAVRGAVTRQVEQQAVGSASKGVSELSKGVSKDVVSEAAQQSEKGAVKTAVSESEKQVAAKPALAAKSAAAPKPPSVSKPPASPNRGRSLNESKTIHDDVEKKLVTELEKLGAKAERGANKTLKGADGKTFTAKKTDGMASSRKPDVVLETQTPAGPKATGLEVKTSTASQTVDKAAKQLQFEATNEGSLMWNKLPWTLGQGSGVVYAPYGVLQVMKASFNN